MQPRVRVRAATPTDHASFARLVPELAVDDPIPNEERFVRNIVPTTVIAESSEDAAVLGYAYFGVIKDVVYVRHIVTAPEARRRGVARALLAAIVVQARAAGCSGWCLNVKPGNVAAITLYESVGLRRAHTSRALDLTWSSIENAPRIDVPGVTAKDIAPAEDARVETAMRLLDGQLASGRDGGGRVLKMLEEGGRVVGAASFDPDFPGAYPFRVSRPELAVVLLRALQPHARPADAKVGVVTEDQPDVAEALMAAGATLKLDIVHMKGPLPSV